MSSKKLAGKVAIVTGAGQGAGMGAALSLAEGGAAVILFGRTFSKVEAIANKITERGGQALAFGGDVTNQTDRKASIALAIERFGRVDVLVNAAQSPEMRTALLLDITPEVIADLWNSGAAATLAFMQEVHPIMAKQGGGSIVNFGSGGEFTPQHYGVYSGVKAAIRTISRAAAVEWGKDRIRVNVVVPMVESPSNDADPTDHALIVARVPLGRIGDPEKDIGAPIAFLASDESSYITGSTFMLDGGLAYLK